MFPWSLCRLPSRTNDEDTGNNRWMYLELGIIEPRDIELTSLFIEISSWSVWIWKFRFLPVCSVGQECLITGRIVGNVKFVLERDFTKDIRYTYIKFTKLPIPLPPKITILSIVSLLSSKPLSFINISHVLPINNNKKNLFRKMK